MVTDVLPDVFALIGLLVLLLVLAATTAYLFWIARQNARSAREYATYFRSASNSLRVLAENRDNLICELQMAKDENKRLSEEAARLTKINETYKRQIGRSAEKKEA